MNLIADIISFSSDQKNVSDNEAVATVGFFDGLHAGHRFLMSELKRIAGLKSAVSMVLTFTEHPRKALKQPYIPRLLTTFDEKKQLFAQTGIDKLVVLNFTPKFSHFTAEEFIGLLAKEFNVRYLLTGYDHRFGKNRTDGFQDYVKYGNKHGVEIIQADVYSCENVHISATGIRRLIESGNIRQANRYLTYRYRLEGEVVKGRQFGHTIGFPTANIDVTSSEKIFPEPGVYAVRTYFDDSQYDGMMNIGYHPTIEISSKLLFEVHLFDYDGNIYGKKITVEFVDFVRKEIKFSDIRQLQTHLEEDKHKIINILKTCG
ncbi:MAG: bifunctional riboflavin kinase/FAD synthetase [Bacteroidales bacterium]|jgi:riboflavin kinase/FMN adenylyltransferase|nr:bifunctional riboflavin kinase/FAD synthetase [Bacteroidales bacterium]